MTFLLSKKAVPFVDEIFNGLGENPFSPGLSEKPFALTLVKDEGHQIYTITDENRGTIYPTVLCGAFEQIFRQGNVAKMEAGLCPVWRLKSPNTTPEYQDIYAKQETFLQQLQTTVVSEIERLYLPGTKLTVEEFEMVGLPLRKSDISPSPVEEDDHPGDSLFGIDQELVRNIEYGTYMDPDNLLFFYGELKAMVVYTNVVTLQFHVDKVRMIAQKMNEETVRALQMAGAL
ncbi:hypothetical protein CVT24_005450 [Panaeolus cyanescens]|uniref:Uncharacterized protein n=1 Tax=Panaeolus cyanescens TaxID=181874 RepID=A0A409YC79_9AGAR|nr:hypothetical protein CVT24_005450 [Panaeolus cyanescens]